MKSRAELVDSVLFGHRELMRNLHSPNDWSRLDITMGQLKALLVLACCETPLTVSAISDQLGLSRPAGSTLVDHLVHMKLVDRREDATDRRRTNVQLTMDGEQLTSRLQQGGQDMIRACLQFLSDEDLEALARGTNALAEAARRHNQMTGNAKPVEE